MVDMILIVFQLSHLVLVVVRFEEIRTSIVSTVWKFIWNSWNLIESYRLFPLTLKIPALGTQHNCCGQHQSWWCWSLRCILVGVPLYEAVWRFITFSYARSFKFWAKPSVLFWNIRFVRSVLRCKCVQSRLTCLYLFVLADIEIPEVQCSKAKIWFSDSVFAKTARIRKNLSALKKYGTHVRH